MTNDDVLEECLPGCDCTDVDTTSSAIMVVFDKIEQKCYLYVSTSFQEMTANQQILVLHTSVGLVKSLLLEVCEEAEVEYGGLVAGMASGETGMA